MVQIVTKTLAEIYWKQGDLQKAREIYQLLSERDPVDPEVQKRLEELNRILNRPPDEVSSAPLTREERIQYLERWLSQIQKRKKK